MIYNIDPAVDCVFKVILGSEKNKNLLIHFLNAVLEKDEQERITDVIITNPYNEREFEADKLSIVDIKARDEMDNTYQVEIQLAVYPDLPPRMLFTWSSIYRSLLGKGEDYNLLTPVISIWILRDCLFPETDDCHLPFLAWNLKNGIMLSDHFAIHVLQLPKWNMRQTGHTEKDRWLYLFKEGVNVDIDNPPEILNTDEMRQAMSVVRDFSENQKNYLLYQSRLDALSVLATWKGERERALKEKNQALKEKDQALKEKDQILKEKDQILKEKDQVLKEKDQVLKEKDQAIKEKEKLLLLLKKAGIDPEQEI